MENNVYNLIYDLKKRLMTDAKFMQGDKDSSSFRITLVDGGKVVDITGETIQFRFYKQDKTIVYQDASTGVTIIDGPKGIVECVLKSDTLSYPGTVKCEIHRAESGKELTTPSFNFRVDASIGESGILSTNYIGAIENKIIDWQSEINAINAEYEIYKSVMIDASPVANLQNQINNNVASLANMTTQVGLKAPQTSLDTTNSNITLKANITDVNIQIANVASGTPRTTYATLALLQAGIPLGNIYSYVCTDGLRYYWNGSGWVSGGVYQSTGISSKSVNDKSVNDQSIFDYHVNFIKKGKNLFNKELALINTYINTSGINATLAGYATSADMPIKAGVSYVIMPCRYIAIYNNDMALVERSDTGGALTQTIKTPVSDGYIRVTVYNGTSGIYQLDKCQIEVGATATGYEAYYLDMQSNLKVSAENVIGKFPPNKATFISTGKNLFNSSKRLVGMYLLADNTTLAGSQFDTSEFIQVESGKTYHLNVCRKFCSYNNFKGLLTYFDGTNIPYTFTATQDGYIRFSYTNTYSSIQFEEGSIGTVFEAFKFIIPNLSMETVNLKPLTIIKSGENFSIISKLDNGDDIQIDTKRNGSANSSFNFISTKINGNLIHENQDDITPIRTFYTVGANHGYPNVTRVTMVGHDKTIADLGSKWTDGVSEYTLLDINVNDLIFGCPYTTDGNGISTSLITPPIANLTHVSGATHTTAVTITTLASSPQLYPSTNNVNVKYVLDGFELTTDGNYYGNELQVQESYNIMDYKAIIDYAQANIGVSYKGNIVEGVVKMSVNHTFTKGCRCLISQSIKALKKVNLGVCGFIQSVGLGLAGHTLKRYMPNVLPKSGFDFKNIVDMTTYATDLEFYTADLIIASKPPNRCVDWLYNGTDKKYGFTVGYIADKTNTKNADRITNIGVSNFWDMRGTKKSYPTVLGPMMLNIGDYKTFLGYRNYISPTTATNISIVKDKKDTYVYIDYHVNVNGGNVKLNDFIGKTVTVLDSENFTLLNDTVDSEGVTFNIINNYGYAVLKLS